MEPTKIRQYAQLLREMDLTALEIQPDGTVRLERNPSAPAAPAERAPDDRDVGWGERAEELSGRILEACLEAGGSITGEHGVGFDKKQYLPKQFSAEDLDTMQLVRCAFDPDGRANPGKVFPTPRLCGERPGPRRVHPAEQAGLAEVF